MVKSMVEMGFDAENAENQVFWGDSIMFAPQVDFNWMKSPFAHVLCPVDMFDIETGIKCNSRKTLQKVEMGSLPRIPVFLLAGNIIFRQMETKSTLTETRKSPFRVEIAINSDLKSDFLTKTIFWDNDDNLDFQTNHFLLKASFDSSTFSIQISADQSADGFDTPDVDEVIIYSSNTDQCPDYYRISFGIDRNDPDSTISTALKVKKEKIDASSLEYEMRLNLRIARI